MKKKLLFSLFMFVFFAGQVVVAGISDSRNQERMYAGTSVSSSVLCPPNPKYRPYAFISKIEFLDNVKTIKYDDAEQWIDLTNTHVLGLESGGSHTLTVTVKNYDSGMNDPYAARIWIDWNNDGALTTDEVVGTQQVARIGAAGSEHSLEFNINVPEDVVGPNIEFTLRIMLYYKSGNFGEDPCGEYEGGTIVDLGCVIGEGKFEKEEPEEPEPDPEEVCLPNWGYWSYVNIDQVKFGGMVSQSSVTGERPEGVFDYRQDTERQAHLNAGETYQMDISVSNFDSGDRDPYIVRAYVDWNNNKRLELDELESRKQNINQIGAVGKENIVSFSFTVPDDAVLNEALHMRVLVHFKRGLDGETEACDNFDSGQYQEYYVFVKTKSGLNDNSLSQDILYPNPTKGILYLDKITDMTGCSLYSADGKLMSVEKNSTSSIDLSKYAKGIYILKVQTSQGNIIKKIILE